MSEDNKTKFGNMPLGMINKMLVSFIGEDAFLDYCEKYHKDWKLDWQSREAFRKHLDRLFEEKESSYRDLNPHYEQSVYRIAFKILDDFCNKYGLPRYIADTILDFYDLLRLRLRLSGTEYPVFETYYTLDSVIRGFLHIFFEIDEIGTNNDADFSYRDAETKYNMVFDELGKKFKDKNGEKSSLEKFYTKLSNWYSGKIKGQVLSDHFKKIIINNCKKGQNPAKWKDMKTILDFCKEKGKDLEVAHLIEAYLTANVKNFIVEIQEENWKEIGFCFEYIEKNVSNKTGLLYEFHQRLFNPLGDKSEPIDSALLEILIKHVYLQDEKRAEDLISNIKEIAPEASDFYCNWLRAYIAVAKCEFENAKKLYNEAFGNIHFAGIWAEVFLKQAFVLSVYCDLNPDSVRKVIDPEKDAENPLPQDGKRFWEYGYAIEVFDEPAKKIPPKLVYWRENFFAEIPQEMFFSGIKIAPDRTKPTPAGNFVFCAGNIKEKIKEYYNSLSAFKKGSINKRLKIFDGDAQRRPPLSAAIYLFTNSSREKFTDLEEKFLDLIEKWLGLSDPETAIKELEFNTISELGETPLNMATMAYKDFCAKNSDPESPVKKRLRKIVTHILGKTDKNHLRKVTERKRIHPLQNVIDSCDIELVKEFVEKFLEVKLDIDSIRFTTGKVSPVYYTIGRIFNLQHPKAISHPENTNWKYADMPRINAEDKKRNFDDKMNYLTLEAQVLLNEYAIKDDLGDESTYMEQIKKLKEICLYLIDHTKDQDAYKFSNNRGAERTSLTFAAETDDADICRALLKHGADPNIFLETEWGNEIPNTFLHRCIQHEAWNVLEMFLTEFKEKAAETIKKYNNSGKYAPFVFFFEKNKEKRTGFMEKFIKLFESCGVDLTIIPTDKFK